MSLKPIHKFNGGIGATLCHKCKKIITTGLTDDLYCEEHGGNQLPYKIIRSNDNLTKTGKKINFIEWNDNGSFKAIHDEIGIGRSLVLDHSGATFKWMTTRIESYIIEGNVTTFETKNSTYKLYANENK